MIAYIVIYNIGPVKKWWGEIPYHYGIRDSQFMYVTVMLSYFIKPVKTNLSLTVLDRQEWLLILYLCLLWFSTIIGLDLGQDTYNVFKITKVVVILILASHIITDIKLFEMFWWSLILCNIYMGYNAFFASDWMFSNNRLDIGIGSVDFGEANFLAAHMVMMLPITGVMLIRSGNIGKLICLVNAVLTVNTLAMLRSRGGFLAMVVSLGFVIFLAEKKYRLLIIAGTAFGIIGFFALTDVHFWDRISTISVEEQDRDSSAQGRLALWNIAWEMAKEHPLGIGADNYKPLMGSYGTERHNRDTHSTYFKCLAEIGFHGLLVLGLLIYNCFNILFQIRKIPIRNAQSHIFRLYSFGLIIALISYLTAGIFISMNYIEEFYWMLMMPLFLKRSIITANAQEQ
ncbi:MAG: O-antigen ligase family protein [Proteobacteria bacterium]|nr:O-antigen ligase family protein [Pseudomonadota bacterium]MBU1581830.1 O-antigen ligase family protein [Pseudomonadota bacterium]MBU2454406.1 O-antigen ligase family protein [Pseudomonadota bacterium]MBU2627892.1 O-antigen ligase family protein [Pseudomonadota bacterium]